MAQALQEQVSELLTEEELAALDESDFMEAGDDDTPPVTATDDPAGAAESDDDDDAGVYDDAGFYDDSKAADPAPSPAPAAVAEAEDDDPAPAPVDKGRLTALQAEYEATESEIAELTTQFEDGDFTSAEFSAKLRELNGKLIDVQSDAKLIQRQVKADDDAWNGAVSTYFDTYPDLKASDAALLAFDANVKYITENFPNLSFKAQLARAHDRLLAEAGDRGLTGLTPRSGKPPVRAPNPAAKAQAKPDDGMRTPPTTLARAPASEISGEADSALIQMQRLVNAGDSDKIEAAYFKLTPDQRDQFSNMDL
jgi:hypothetical protein